MEDFDDCQSCLCVSAQMMAEAGRKSSVHLPGSLAMLAVSHRTDKRLYNLGHAGDWNGPSYLARPLDAEQTRILRHDAIPFPTRKAAGLLPKNSKICADQVIRSEQELVSQKREQLYARVVEDVPRGNRSPTQKCANSNGK
jgi:hypothetical protein